MERIVDLRSDTVTLPTRAMREVMAAALVGDDVYREDPTVNCLEERAAALLGKEKALFVTSGTMGNQLAVLSLTAPGQEIICEETAHIYVNEAGGLARLGGVQAATIAGTYGMMPLEMIERKIRARDIHYPVTGLIALENTHNSHGGCVLPMEYLHDVRALADAHHLPVYMDGARVFNAAIALGVPVRDIAAAADTVSFCLSKGLGAPVGSMLCGSAQVIERARGFRKMLGGGMRQAGILAAAGLLAIETMVDRLAEDHENARALAEGLAEVSGVNVWRVDTNLVYFTLPVSAPAVAAAMRERGVLVSAVSGDTIRAVTHYGIEPRDMEETVEAVRAIVA